MPAKSVQVFRSAAVALLAVTVAGAALSSRTADWEPLWLFFNVYFGMLIFVRGHPRPISRRGVLLYQDRLRFGPIYIV